MKSSFYEVFTRSVERYKLIVREDDEYSEAIKIFRQFHDGAVRCAKENAPSLIAAIARASDCTLEQIALGDGRRVGATWTRVVKVEDGS